MNNRQQTPLEKLLADKARLQEECKAQETKLNETLCYFQENAGSLLISGLSSLLFPPNKSTNKTKETNQSVSKDAIPPVSFGLSDYISIAKGLLPVAWEIIQPIMLSWGIKKARKMITSLFRSKKSEI